MPMTCKEVLDYLVKDADGYDEKTADEAINHFESCHLPPCRDRREEDAQFEEFCVRNAKTFLAALAMRRAVLNPTAKA